MSLSFPEAKSSCVLSLLIVDELASQFHDVLDTVERPTVVIRGSHGALKAARNLGKKKWLVVIYKELTKKDGFIITAYMLSYKPKGEVIWRV